MRASGKKFPVLNAPKTCYFAFMFVTHIYTLLAWMLFVALTVLPLPLRLGRFLPGGNAVGFGYFAVCVAFSAAIFWIVLIPLSTWLYLKTFRGTAVTFGEAKEFTPLFFLNKSATWYPMKELANIPPAERPQYLRNFLQEKRRQGLIK